MKLNINKNSGPERRNITGVELRAAEGEKFAITGVAIAYNTASSLLGGVFKEIIAPGAFARSIASRDIKALWSHSTAQVLGRTKNRTLTLQDTAEGLQFNCQLNRSSQAHRDIYASVQRGDVDSCSFGFEVPDGGDEITETTDENGRRVPLRTVKNGILHEISIVAFPAYPKGTSADARSSFSGDYSFGLCTHKETAEDVVEALRMKNLEETEESEETISDKIAQLHLENQLLTLQAQNKWLKGEDLSQDEIGDEERQQRLADINRRIRLDQINETLAASVDAPTTDEERQARAARINAVLAEGN